MYLQTESTSEVGKEMDYFECLHGLGDCRHTTCTCRELQSYNFLGYEVMSVSLLNPAAVMPVGSLAATCWQQSWALCRTTLCPVCVFCRTLLLPSGQVLKSKPGKIFSTSWLGIRIGLRRSVVNTILDAGGTGNEGWGWMCSIIKCNHLWVPILLPFHSQTSW